MKIQPMIKDTPLNLQMRKANMDPLNIQAYKHLSLTDQYFPVEES